MPGNYTHFFHPYPAKFPADIVRKCIAEYSKEGERVIDPFCGSGTALVESKLLGRNAFGIDINPVGVLISKAKSANYADKDLLALDSVIEQVTGAVLVSEMWIEGHTSDSLPTYENRQYWFSDSVIRELNAIQSELIAPFKEQNPTLYELLMTAFSRIIVQVSNQDTETRYARVEKNIKVGETLKLFLKTLKAYRKAFTEAEKPIAETRVEVIEGDTLKELPKLAENSFDMAITSPPYINSFDYYLYHKHRIFLLNKSPMLVRKTEIGGHHTIDGQTYDKAFNEYRSAMKTVFECLHKILKPNKKFVLLIGDGIVKGKVINSAELMEAIAKETDFCVLKTETVPLKQVSKTFIKDKKIERKKHHLMVFVNHK